jgi:hypothetical protein
MMIKRPRRTKLTTRGTPRLTRAERSQAMKRAWKTRRSNQGITAKPKRRRKPNPIRSKALRKAWARRFREGTAKRKTKKPLLTHEERSEIAKAAANLRRLRREAAVATGEISPAPVKRKKRRLTFVERSRRAKEAWAAKREREAAEARAKAKKRKARKLKLPLRLDPRAETHIGA